MALHEAFGFGYREAQIVTLNAVESAFCDDSTKARLRGEIQLAYQREMKSDEHPGHR